MLMDIRKQLKINRNKKNFPIIHNLKQNFTFPIRNKYTLTAILTNIHSSFIINTAQVIPAIMRIIKFATWAGKVRLTTTNRLWWLWWHGGWLLIGTISACSCTCWTASSSGSCGSGCCSSCGGGSCAGSGSCSAGWNACGRLILTATRCWLSSRWHLIISVTSATVHASKWIACWAALLGQWSASRICNYYAIVTDHIYYGWQSAYYWSIDVLVYIHFFTISSAFT